MSIALRRIAGLAAVLAVMAVAVTGASAASVGQLDVTYEMNCSFTLTKDGRSVGTLEPGEYSVVVTTPVPYANPDQQASSIVYLPICDGSARFSLTGPGVNLHSTVGDGNQVRAQYSVTLQPSASYTAADDKGQSLGRFVFGTSGASQDAGSSAGTSTDTAAATKLDVSTTSAGAVKLVLGGKLVTRVRPGSYTLVLNDRSAKAGYTLRSPSGKLVRVTTAKFVGKASKRVKLGAGRWLLALGNGKARTLIVA